jgi:hypothetical protein
MSAAPPPMVLGTRSVLMVLGARGHLRSKRGNTR